MSGARAIWLTRCGLAVVIAAACSDPRDLDTMRGDSAAGATDGAAASGDGAAPLDAADAAPSNSAADAQTGRAGAGAAEPIEPHFADVAAEAGLDYMQAPLGTILGCEDLPESKCAFSSIHMSGGAAAGDFDGDGLVDLFVTRLHAAGILYRNAGAGHFEDVSERYGLATAPAGSNGAGFADIDNDGDLDLYVTTVLERRFHLYVNTGERFVEEGLARGAAVATDYRHHGFSVAFGDYDRDGFLDLHTTEWVQLEAQDPAPNHARLLHNLGRAAPGYFEDVTDAAGVNLFEGPRATRTSFASDFSDLDFDGWPELLIVADFNTSRLFWNEGDGAFIDGTAFSGVGTDLNGMGSALGDYDGDGDTDWFVTAIYDPDYRCDGISCAWGTTGNRLYRNQGDRRFDDATDVAGVRDGGWGWGAAFFDYDNDGDLDLVMTNGVDYPNPEAELFRSDPLRLWRNDGDGTFTDVAASAGIDAPGDGRGLLVFDYDQDGDEDLLIVQHEGSPQLLRNDGGNAHAWLRVRLIGELSNRDGIGARVMLHRRSGDLPLVREIRGGSQFLGQSERIAHFGLGRFDGSVADLRVLWPSGVSQVLHDVATRQTLVLSEP